MMNALPKIDRRSFVVGAATAGSGLALGVALPWNSSQAATTEGSPEVNAWVVIKPDESVIIRIPKSEMGQGTLTGIAQLVAE